MLVFIESLEGCKPWFSPSVEQQGRGLGKVDLYIATDFTTKSNTLSEATWNILYINCGKKFCNNLKAVCGNFFSVCHSMLPVKQTNFITVKWENNAAQFLFAVKGISFTGKVQLHSRAEVPMRF